MWSAGRTQADDVRLTQSAEGEETQQKARQLGEHLERQANRVLQRHTVRASEAAASGVEQATNEHAAAQAALVDAALSAQHAALDLEKAAATKQSAAEDAAKIATEELHAAEKAASQADEEHTAAEEDVLATAMVEKSAVKKA